MTGPIRSSTTHLTRANADVELHDDKQVAQKANITEKPVDLTPDLPRSEPATDKRPKLAGKTEFAPAQKKELDSALAAYKKGDKDDLSAFVAKHGGNYGPAVMSALEKNKISLPTVFANASPKQREDIIGHFGATLDIKDRTRMMSTLFKEDGVVDTADTRAAYALVATAPKNDTAQILRTAEKTGITSDALMAFASMDPADTAMIKRLDDNFVSERVMMGKSPGIELIRSYNGGDLPGVSKADVNHLLATGELTADMKALVDSNPKAGKMILEAQAKALGERFVRNDPESMTTDELAGWKTKFHDLEAQTDKIDRKIGAKSDGKVPSPQEYAVDLVRAFNTGDGNPSPDAVYAKMKKDHGRAGERAFLEAVPHDVVWRGSADLELLGRSLGMQALRDVRNGGNIMGLADAAAKDPEAKKFLAAELKNDPHLAGQLRSVILDPQVDQKKADHAKGLYDASGLKLSKDAVVDTEHDRQIKAAFKAKPIDYAALNKLSAAIPEKERDDHALHMRWGIEEARKNGVEVDTSKLSPAEVRYATEAKLAVHNLTPEQVPAMMKKYGQMRGAEALAYRHELAEQLKDTQTLRGERVGAAMYKAWMKGPESYNAKRLLEESGSLETVARREGLEMVREAVRNGKKGDLDEIGYYAAQALGPKAEAAFAKDVAKAFKNESNDFELASRLPTELRSQVNANLVFETESRPKEVAQAYAKYREQAIKDGTVKQFDETFAARLKSDPKLRSAVGAEWKAMSDADPKSEPLGRMLYKAGYRASGSMAASTTAPGAEGRDKYDERGPY